MSPEQIEGRDADARSDIFAFGAILYEMATGRRAFEGKSQLSIASAILEKEPEPLSSAQPSAPPALDDLVRTCLAKDPNERHASAHDVKLQLRRAARVSQPPAQDRDLPRPNWLVWIAAGLVLALVAAIAVFAILNSHHQERTLLSAQILPPSGMSFSLTGDQGASSAISPDGRFIAVGAGGHLWLRQTATGTYLPLPGTNDASFPFWSPDSRSIGFFSQAKLKTTDINGGAVVTVCDAPSARGASWGADNLIVFAPTIQAPLSKVSASEALPSPSLPWILSSTLLTAGLFSCPMASTSFTWRRIINRGARPTGSTWVPLTAKRTAASCTPAATPFTLPDTCCSRRMEICWHSVLTLVA